MEKNRVGKEERETGWTGLNTLFLLYVVVTLLFACWIW